jgi:hypothetical protein
MTRTGYFVRLAISAAIDLADFTFGRALFWVPWEEGAGAVLLFFLWGWPGLLYAGELIEPSEQVDASLPSATLIALAMGLRNGHLLGRYGNLPQPRRSNG